MKTNTKLAALAISAAVIGSGITLMASSVLKDKGVMGDTYLPAVEQKQDFIRTVSQPVAIETDFTKAAESTINSVVSIKSYATPRQQQYYQGGDDFFGIDPFEFFFGPGNGNSQRRKQQQQQKSDAKPQPSVPMVILLLITT